MSTWDRAAVAAQLRPRLWRYLSGAAAVQYSVGPALAPEGLSRAELVRLHAAHLALRPSTREALSAAERLLAELPSSQATTRVELFGEVRGRVDWVRTSQRRTALADPTVFVCTPPERRYDTPLGRLLRLSLWCASQLADLSQVPAKGTAGVAVHDISDRARRLLLHPKLSKVRRVEPGAIRMATELIERRPYVAPLLKLAQDFWLGEVEGDRAALIDSLEGQFLAPESDATLFELQVGFDILAALEALGFSCLSPTTLLPSGSVPFAELLGPAGTAAVHWQRPAWSLDASTQRLGAWSRILAENGLSQHPLRPDFLIELPQLNRRILVEVKLTALAEGSPERDGLRDVLAYLTDAETLFFGKPHPHALIAAWNARGRPMSNATRVQISSQDHVVDTLTRALAIDHLVEAE